MKIFPLIARPNKLGLQRLFGYRDQAQATRFQSASYCQYQNNRPDARLVRTKVKQITAFSPFRGAVTDCHIMGVAIRFRDSIAIVLDRAPEITQLRSVEFYRCRATRQDVRVSYR